MCATALGLLVLLVATIGCGSTARKITPGPAKSLEAAPGDVVFKLEEPIIPPPRTTQNVYRADLDIRGTDWITVTFAGLSSDGQVLFSEEIVSVEWTPDLYDGAGLQEGTIGERAGQRVRSRQIELNLNESRDLELYDVRIRVRSAGTDRLVYDLRDVKWD